MAFPFLHFLLITFTFFFITSTTQESLAAKTQFKPNSFVLKVNKDSETGLHIANIQKRTPRQLVPFLVDLNGRFLWVTCDDNYLSSTYNAPKCHSTQCSKAIAQSCFTCSSKVASPGCHNNTCGLIATNPVTRKTSFSELAQDVLSIQSTRNQGSNLGPIVTIPNFLFACAPSLLLTNGLPKTVRGDLGFGHANIALPTQLSSFFGIQPTFAMCLTTMGGNGAIFFGNGPYNMVPGLDISKSLRFTPLIISPRGEYYIQVTSIRVNKKDVPIKTSLLPYQKGGNGGTMISTTSPYTILEHSIYQSLVQIYAQQFSYKKVKQVKPVAPFGLCFDATNVRRTRFGYDVPTIDLVLHNSNTVWSILGSNSMVQPRPGVLCLGFVDGGLSPKIKASVVIGAYQLEDNILQFDIAKSRLGFGSVPVMGTTCGNFNFTSYKP